MKKLFDKTKILNMELKNRFFRGGLWEELAAEESLYVSKRLAELGINAIEVSGGN